MQREVEITLDLGDILLPLEDHAVASIVLKDGLVVVHETEGHPFLKRGDLYLLMYTDVALIQAVLFDFHCSEMLDDLFCCVSLECHNCSLLNRSNIAYALDRFYPVR